ncbi:MULTISPECIES: hypothetical protein [Klebsiella/Raoultella group]|uniref:endonuclease toxin domain-containing protein n=1 Tax=Klebsiella/Raoultella group TaxID=2890311 RepID=UPI001151A157
MKRLRLISILNTITDYNPALSGREDFHILKVPANTTKTQWTEINSAIEYGKSLGVTVKVTQVK